MAAEHEHGQPSAGAFDVEMLEQLLEGVLSLPVESQLGFLLLVTPQILGRFPPEARDQFLKELAREIQRTSASEADGGPGTGESEPPVPEM